MARPNLITDPGFESGITGWTCATATLSWERTTVHAGTGALRAAVTTAGILVYSPVISLATIGTGTFYASMWAYVDAAAARQILVGARVKKQDGTYAFLAAQSLTPAVRTWVQLTGPVTVPADAVEIQLYGNSPSSGLLPGETLIMDDVELGPRTTLAISSAAAANGYGYWTYTGATEPPAASVAYTLTPYTGATNVTGTTTAAGATSNLVLNRDATAGTRTGQLDVTGSGIAKATFTMADLAVTMNQVGNRVTPVLKWAVKTGDDIDPTYDAHVFYGDSTAFESALMGTTTADKTEGVVRFKGHTYPYKNTTETYSLSFGSGERAYSTDVTVPAITRATVVTEDGQTAAQCDIQQWPERQFNRDSAVLTISGRADPVVLLDTLRLASSTITFLTLDQAEGEQLHKVLSSTGRLQLVSPCPGVENVWFTALRTAAQRLTNTGSDMRRLWPTDIQEVEAPA